MNNKLCQFLKAIIKVYPKYSANVVLIIVANIILIITPTFFSISAQSEWIPSVWIEYLKNGPVKDNLPDFSHVGYKMGRKQIPDADKTSLPIFDVTSSKFGAIPNDGVDDTSAIQSAIDAAGDAGGGIVYLPKGFYDIHKTQKHGFIQIRHDHIILRGENSSFSYANGNKSANNKKSPQTDLRSTSTSSLTSTDSFASTNSETILHFGSPGKPDRIYRLGTVPAEQEGRHWTTIAVMGSESTKELTRYTRDVMRGNREIHVMDTSHLNQGQTVIIEFDDPIIDPVNPSSDKVDIAAQLTHPLKLLKIQTDTIGKISKRITWIVKIETIVDQKRILLAEPVRFNQFLRYSPRILSFNGVEGVGIENLTIQSSWEGGYRHHKPFLGKDGKVVRTAKEQDYLWGGIWLSSAIDGWIRNVKFNNLTQGIIFSRCGYMTAKDLTFQGIDGHAGITIAHSHGIFVERTNFYARSVHPVSLKNFASGNVISDCEIFYDGRDENNATDAVIDFHGLFPYENLFENMRGFYICPGGDTSVMPHSGVRNVFWNIEAPVNMSCYSCELKDEFMRTYDYGNTSSKTPATMYEYQPQGFFVGITRRGNKPVTMAGNSFDKRNKWMTVEGLNKKNLGIPSLYKAQYNQATAIKRD